jgi:hypothetical protein
MKVKAIEKMYYGGRDRMPGEVYEMDDRQGVEINVLCLLKKIELVKGEAPTEQSAAATPTESIDLPLTYRTSDLKAEEPQPEEEPTKRRYYRRRDSRAEE